ncbi:TetR/AcrR family transcriptional regulator [Nocardia higoensis]|uniref:TetR/AcrR family transcriptional regulator n=1 Tax=Nocardia higoensis TaxID=228599 RepID=A0ABS0DHI5_9NOCA|nr:TetR/AcrR family transcriptional regulator [Nocardia higoensis]MBF6357916.1 TetR/AcrR family transcriptional regulator [Nocardia higoensis]
MAQPDAADSIIAGGGTKMAIRDAAVELFGSKGFEQTSLREVADAVGITKASLYYHYPSKLDLLLAIIDPVVENIRAVVADIDGLAHDAENARRVLRDYLRGMIRHRDAGSMCVRDTVAVYNAVSERYPDVLEAGRVLTDWLAGPEASDEARVRAAAAISVITTALTAHEYAPGARAELLETTLLDAATSVLNVRVTA